MDTAITITAALGFLTGAMSIGMWLWPAVSRVRTERDRLQSVVDGLRNGLELMATKLDRSKTECRILTKERDSAVSDCQAMTDKIAKLTDDCVEFQRLAHQAQDGLDMAKDMLSGEMAAHKATKRQLAAAKGQITRLRRNHG